MKKLKYLVIHCTATPEGRKVTKDDIIRWHTGPIAQGGRGWRQVGYSEMIHLDGEMEKLVDYNCDEWVQNGEITNGAGKYNVESRHIVYVGGMNKEYTAPKNTLTSGQFGTLHEYIKDFIKLHDDIIVVGHNQLHAKACPSFDVYDVFGCVIPLKNRLQ